RETTLAARLVPEPQLVDELPVAGHIGSLEVVQQPATPADHLEQPPTPVEILGVRAKVPREIVDPLREERDLNLGRPRIGLVYLVPIYRRCFFKRHVVYSPSTCYAESIEA